jgi:hypothetical protein
VCTRGNQFVVKYGPFILSLLPFSPHVPTSSSLIFAAHCLIWGCRSSHNSTCPTVTLISGSQSYCCVVSSFVFYFDIHMMLHSVLGRNNQHASLSSVGENLIYACVALYWHETMLAICNRKANFSSHHLPSIQAFPCEDLMKDGDGARTVRRLKVEKSGEHLCQM